MDFVWMRGDFSRLSCFVQDESSNIIDGSSGVCLTSSWGSFMTDQGFWHIDPRIRIMSKQSWTHKNHQAYQSKFYCFNSNQTKYETNSAFSHKPRPNSWTTNINSLYFPLSWSTWKWFKQTMTNKSSIHETWIKHERVTTYLQPCWDCFENLKAKNLFFFSKAYLQLVLPLPILPIFFLFKLQKLLQMMMSMKVLYGSLVLMILCKVDLWWDVR